MRLPYLSGAPFSPEDFLDKIIPNFWSFLIQLLALAALIVAVYFLAYRPLRKLIAKRREYVEENLDGAKQARKKAEAAEREAVHRKDDAKAEAAAIVATAKAEAKKEAEGIYREGREKLEKAEAESRSRIAKEEEDAKKELKRAAASLAMDATGRLLKEKVDSASDRKLVEGYIDELSDEGK